MTRPDGVTVLSVDMGGTTTRIGACRNGDLLPGVVRFATPVPVPGGSVRESHLNAVAAAADRVRRDHPGVTEVAVAAGATVNAAGVVRNAAMLWHQPSTGFDLAAALAARLPWADVHVCNDIAAAAWRYRSLGRFGLITVSTGLAVKVFDDGLPFDRKLLLDAEQLGGEIGHVRLDWPGGVDGGPADYRSLGRAAADGDTRAREALAAAGLPWCECGNVNDLCSYASGPGTVRLAALYTRREAGTWRESKLRALCDGDPGRISGAALATAAKSGDEFTARVLRAATRPLAVQAMQMSALLGLYRFVVMGGFAHGVGEPWFSALRANLRDLRPEGGWFTGWTEAALDALVQPSLDGDDSLIGAAESLVARHAHVRELAKPVAKAHTEVRWTARPACGPHQFAVRVAFAGICGTDLQILRGERDCEPGVLGHECVGRVVEVGRDVPGVSVGQVIGINPNRPDNEHDKIGHNEPGVLREHVVWEGRLAERGQLIPLPEAGRAEWVLLEPLACTVRSLRLAARYDRVLVVGGGVAGLLHVLLARRWGAGQVLLANRSQGRLRVAVERGLMAPAGCLPAGPDLPDLVAERTGGAGVDAVIVSVGAGAGPSVVESMWPALADGATVHLFGGFPPSGVLRTPEGGTVAISPIRHGRSYPVALPGRRTCVLVGSRGASAEDFATAVDLVATATSARETTGPVARETTGPARETTGPVAPLNLASLVSHVVSLDAVPAVLDTLARDGTVAGQPALRVVVDMALRGHVVRPVHGEGLPHLGTAE